MADVRAAPVADAAAQQGDQQQPQNAAAAPAVTFAKRQRRGNIRKRPAADEEEEAQLANAEPEPAVVRKTKSSRAGDNPLAFSTKRPEEDRAEVFTFESSRTLQQAGDNRATATLQTETDFDRDARALREQVLAQATEEGAAAVAAGEYRGMNNYTDFKKGFRREHTIAAEKGGGMHGPLRANVHARVSCRFDYQPDICKDYKETGFCGYGDACKFIHDRSDYKSGWEIEKEWDAQQKAKQKKILDGWDPDAEPKEDGEDEDSDDEALPFACFICRKPWEECQDPVMTRCKHYFCENCALKHNANKKNSGRCAACDMPTGGIFNVASDIEKRMKEQKNAGA